MRPLPPDDRVVPFAKDIRSNRLHAIALATHALAAYLRNLAIHIMNNIKENPLKEDSTAMKNRVTGLFVGPQSGASYRRFWSSLQEFSVKLPHCPATGEAKARRRSPPGRGLFSWGILNLD
jgi:hypothetical protein